MPITAIYKLRSGLQALNALTTCDNTGMQFQVTSKSPRLFLFRRENW